jgi:Na+-transporting methylmalonyl-CoA/oxaloacetate decarboxylase gamma subunit
MNDMDAQLMGQGFEVMVFGLAGVFAVLILFYAATKIMLGIANKTVKKEQ